MTENAARTIVSNFLSKLDSNTECDPMYSSFNFDELLPNQEFAVVSVSDWPDLGIGTYATTNCHKFSSTEFRFEVVTGSRYANDLSLEVAMCAAYLTANCIKPRPGLVLRDILTKEEGSAPFPHIVLVHPFPWAELLYLNETAGYCFFHFMLPISEREASTLNAVGFEAFEQELEESGRDIFDLRERRSFGEGDIGLS